MLTQEPFSTGLHRLRVPELGAEERPVIVVNWLVLPGTEVIAGERLAELLVDSVLFHMESVCNGILSRYLVSAGAVVKQGDAVAEIQLVEND